MSRCATTFPQTKEQIQDIASLPAERIRWHVSRILGLSPFDDAVLCLTDAQVQWIIAQDQIDRDPSLVVKKRYDDKVRALMEEDHG